MNPSSELGRLGEDAARRAIEARGMTVVLANFKAPIGRNSNGATVTGEIDLIALDGNVLCFVEVKTRRSAEFAAPEEAVGRRKRRQIERTAKVYMRIFGLQNMRTRFDVVSVLAPCDGPLTTTLLKAFWTPD